MKIKFTIIALLLLAVVASIFIQAFIGHVEADSKFHSETIKFENLKGTWVSQRGESITIGGNNEINIILDYPWGSNSIEPLALSGNAEFKLRTGTNYYILDIFSNNIGTSLNAFKKNGTIVIFQGPSPKESRSIVYTPKNG